MKKMYVEPLFFIYDIDRTIILATSEESDNLIEDKTWNFNGTNSDFFEE